jgi:MFS family permease
MKHGYKAVTAMLPKKIIRVHIPAKTLAPAMILVLNSLAWFTLTAALLDDLFTRLKLPNGEILALFGLYYAGIAVSALLGAFLFPRARENRLLSWMLFGTIMTALLATIQGNSYPVNVLLCGLLGLSTGMGLPSTLAYFGDTTAVENRGTYGGLTWIVVGTGTLALFFVVGLVDQSMQFVALAVWRATGLIFFFIFSKLRGKLQISNSVSTYRNILNKKDVTLYLLPWIMFSLINFAESPILKSVFRDSTSIIGFAELAISGVFALVGGIFGDFVGRKRVVITGFIFLGIEYAILSLFSGVPVSLYVYTILDGISWGLFASVFFMTVWGDLAESKQKEKYYVLGGLPYLLAGFIPVVVEPLVQGQQISTVIAFSLASFFLFVAVLPLMYAPETLPEKKIKERELQDYVQRAKKTKEKYA